MIKTEKIEKTSLIKGFLLFTFIFATNQGMAAFEINKHTINSGGSKISSNRYQINASMAQVDASHSLSSSRYQLFPGFWQDNDTNSNDLIFKNGFE